MKIKKPSLKGMKNMEHLGHFAKDEHIQKGHNNSGSYSLSQKAIESAEKGPKDYLGEDMDEAKEKGAMAGKLAMMGG